MCLLADPVAVYQQVKQHIERTVRPLSIQCCSCATEGIILDEENSLRCRRGLGPVERRFVYACGERPSLKNNGVVAVFPFVANAWGADPFVFVMPCKVCTHRERLWGETFVVARLTGQAPAR